MNLGSRDDRKLHLSLKDHLQLSFHPLVFVLPLQRSRLRSSSCTWFSFLHSENPASISDSHPSTPRSSVPAPPFTYPSWFVWSPLERLDHYSEHQLIDTRKIVIKSSSVSSTSVQMEMEENKIQRKDN